MRILKIAGAVVAMLVLCGAGCGSAPTAMVTDRPVIANQPPPPSETSLEFDRIVVFVPQGTKVGVESCSGVGIGSPISWKVGDKTLEIGAYRAAFNQELGIVGYNVDRRRSVFENVEQKSRADLIVGASIPEMSLNRCDPALYVAALGTMALLMKKSADATIAVDWEVLDTLEHKVIFRTRTSGQGTATQGSVSIDVAIQAAFQQASRNLARDPAFREAVAKFKHPGDMASVAPAAPLASSTTEVAALSSAPTATTRHVIKGTPLSTKPFSEHVTDIRQQVVVIYSKGGDGSGFFIAPDLLLTNHHVVAEDRFVKVRTLTGRELAGEVLASDARRDIALIRTEKSGLTGLPIRQDEPGIGSQVFVIGTPGIDGIKRGSFEATVTSGIVSAYRDAKRGRFIQSNVQVTHGNSGGPMFDDKGNVIGLTDLGVGEFLNLFIPVNDGLRVLNVEIETPVAIDATPGKASR